MTRRWEDMDSDCLRNIFRRLAADDLATGATFVCKSWHEEATDGFCWTKIDLRRLDFTPGSRLAERCGVEPSAFSFAGFLKLAVRRSRGAATELTFPLVHGASFDDLVYVSKKCPNLKTLVLPRLTIEDEIHLPKLFKEWKFLENLRIESKPCSFAQMIEEISIHCENFSGLSMYGSIKKDDAFKIVSLIPKLKYLDLSQSCILKEELLVIMKGCEGLEELIVKDCIGFEVDDEIIRVASRIKRFEFEGSELRSDDDHGSDEVDCFHVYEIW